MLILDTNVPRYIAEEHRATDVFEIFVKEGGTVHFADGTMLELMAWLHEVSGAWEKWKSIRGRFDGFIDPDKPYMIGGWELLASAGLNFLEAKTPMLPQDVQARLNRLMWERLRHAQVLEELEVHVRIPGTSQMIVQQASGARAQLNAHRRRWVDQFEQYAAAAKAENFAIQDQAALQAKLIPIVANMGASLDRRTISAPPASVRMDAMIRVWVLLSLRSLLRKHKYNPEKDANDSIDLDLYRYLGLPAAICTVEKGVFNDLKTAGAWQLKWVVRPTDLADPTCRASLRNLSWSAMDDG